MDFFLNNRLWTLVIIGLFSCNTEGHRGSSSSIKDSKDRGTFIGQYRVDLKPDTTIRGLLDTLDEVFIEHSWFVNTSRSKVDSTCINIVIKTSELNVDLLTTEYQIRTDFGTNFTRHSKNTLWLCSYNDEQTITKHNLNTSDTLMFKLFKDGKTSWDLLFIKTGDEIASPQHKR